MPCYTLDGANVALIHVFKEYCAVLFPKGALLQDPAGELVIQTENVQAARQLRFTDVGQVLAREPVIARFLAQAIALEKAGAKVAFKWVDQLVVPEEVRAAFDVEPALEAAFLALTPGRQKAYLLHFGEAKQARTRKERVEKHRARILDGKGLDD